MFITIVRKILPSNTRLKIKRFLRNVNKNVQFWVKPVSLEDMRIILTDIMGIKEGDKLFITSSFGGLNAKFAPKDLIDILMDIVTPKGMIMMPYYPPGSSVEWAHSGKEFDMNETVSSTGILTNVFSKMPNVYKSRHPTKSVCVWGKNSEEIISGHINSETPFSIGSPYYNLLKIPDSKSVGLGTMKFPMGHCFEDILSGIVSQYEKERVILKIKDGNAEYECSTLLHDESRNQIPPSLFVVRAPTYKKVKIGYSAGFVVSNSAAFEYYKEQFEIGHKSIW